MRPKLRSDTLPLVAGLMGILACRDAGAQSGIRNASINIGGVNRTYMVYLPAGIPASPPLVFAVHGMTGKNTMIRSYSGWDAVAESESVALLPIP